MADDRPTEGDTYACKQFGMAVLLTEDCKSDGEGPFFACCGAAFPPIPPCDRDGIASSQ